MTLSKIWTGQKLFNEAFSNVGSPLNSIVIVQARELINRACQDVSDLFYPIMASAFMAEPETLSIATSGVNHSSGTGTWTAATTLLTFAGMYSNFTADDVGKLVFMRVSHDGWFAYISDFIDGDNVNLVSATSMWPLPTTDKTVDEVLVFNTTPTADEIDISSLPIMRSEISRVVLESSNLDDPCLPLTRDQFVAFRADDIKYSQRIVYVIEGNKLRLKRGTVEYGTLTIHYPKNSTPIDELTDYIDLPDGPAISIALARLEILMAKRIGMQLNLSQELTSQVQALYQAFNATINENTNKEKVAALSQ
jgi:hypothetical protein